MRRLTRRPQTPAQAEKETSVFRFVPIVFAYVLVPVGPAWTHHFWGQRLPIASVVPCVMLVCLIGIGLVTWVYANAARPKSNKMRVVLVFHSMLTVVLTGFVVMFIQIMGWWGQTALQMLYVVVGAFLCFSWCVRRFDVFQHNPATHEGDAAEQLGLNIKTKKQISSTATSVTTRMHLGDGQTIDDIAKVKNNIGSLVGAMPGGVRVTQAPDHPEGVVDTTVNYASPFPQGDLVWRGPTNPGGSVCDGVLIGYRETGDPIIMYPMGDRAGRVVPGHIGQGGMPRSGKGTCAEIEVAELGTRCDVWLGLADTRKADQFHGDLADMFGWFAQTNNAVRAQVRGYKRAIQARTREMSGYGYKKWTPAVFEDPRLKMPAIGMFWEEAAAYWDEVAEDVIEILESSLSAGMFGHLSQQRWTHDRIPTSVRSSVTNGICFGTQDLADAEYLLSEMTLKQGPNPGLWKTKFPGRMLVEGNGMEEHLFPVPGQGVIAGSDALRQIGVQFRPVRAKLDPVTAKAFGEAYTEYAESRRTLVQVPATLPGAEVEYDDDDESEAYVMPAQPEPELAAGLDPRASVADMPVGDVDLTPEDDGRPVLSPNEKKIAWREMVDRLRRESRQSGNYEITVDELRDAWIEQVGESNILRKWLMYELIGMDIKEGRMERLHTADGGYRLTETEPAAVR